MSIHLRHELGRLLRKCGYRLARERQWPELHGNLLLLGFSLFRARHRGLIQIVQVGVSDGQIDDLLDDILRLENMSAVLVEPQTILCQALVAHY
jgi:hypothetical protein